MRTLQTIEIFAEYSTLSHNTTANHPSYECLRIPSNNSVGSFNEKKVLNICTLLPNEAMFTVDTAVSSMIIGITSYLRVWASKDRYYIVSLSTGIKIR